jgi:hypothetical protein
MRNHYNFEEKEAARILDLAKLGNEDITLDLINWALFVLGDAVGI